MEPHNHRGGDQPKSSGLMTRIAFVVIGRNEGERLRACLESVLTVSTQVVYADSNSSDGSPELAKSLGIAVVDVTSRPLNAARGRNEGLIAARNKFPDATFVQFIDGDCILHPQWAAVAAEFLKDRTDAAVVCGRRHEAKPGASFYNLLADDEWNTPIGQTAACGGDSMMRIEAVEAVGSFDAELMAGEEPELCARLRNAGWTIWRIDAPMTEHDANILSFAQWWRRAVRSGFGYAQVWHRTRKEGVAAPAPQLRSACFWVLLVPMVGIAAALILHRAALLLIIPAAYALQVVRLAKSRQGRPEFRFRSSAFLMVAKLAELAGAARYAISSSYSGSIEYKRSD